MNLYSEISQRVGWKPSFTPIPSVENALELKTKVLAHDPIAFEQLLKIYRFAAMPQGKQEQQALDYIFNGFHQSHQWFKAN